MRCWNFIKIHTVQNSWNNIYLHDQWESSYAIDWHLICLISSFKSFNTWWVHKTCHVVQSRVGTDLKEWMAEKYDYSLRWKKYNIRDETGGGTYDDLELTVT